MLLRADGTVLIGETAERRALTEPTRVAREFKRRMGDPTPFIVGGTPYGVEALTAHVIKWVLALAAEREGGHPDRLFLTHPATWGAYKLDLLGQAARLADSPPFEFLSEPEAAAMRYAQEGRVNPGDVVAVFDFGGGTLDVALVRCVVPDRFELVGQPEGMERLGGIDFDQAVFAHVNDSVDGMLTEIDPDDLQARSALARLRTDCRLAKEALSSDTDAVIPVLLPNLQTEIRITRSEFESMIRPRITEAIETLTRCIRNAGLQTADISGVLLIGGTSRIPLIREMIHAETGLPVTLDSHPKSSISLGATLQAVPVINEQVEAAPMPSDRPSIEISDPADVPVAPDLQASESAPKVPSSERRVSPGLLGLVAAGVLAVAAVIWLLWPGGDDPGVVAESVPTVTTIPTVATEAGGGSESTATTVESTTTVPASAPSEPSDSLPSTTTTTLARAADGYVRVTDGSGTFSIEIPEDWIDIDLDQLVIFEIPSPHISASPNLFEYVETWTTPGITFAIVSADEAGDTRSLNETLAIAFGYADQCVDGGAEEYRNSGLVGDAFIWLDCGGTGNLLKTVAASPGGDFVYLAVAQTTSKAGLEALDRALATVEFTSESSG